MELVRFLYFVEDGFDRFGVKFFCSLILFEKVVGIEIENVNKLLLKIFYFIVMLQKLFIDWCDDFVNFG